MNTLIIAGGCFWGMEDLFGAQSGVVQTEVGYTGGENENPTYQNHPGHAEALKLTFDPQLTSEDRLLDYFFQIHDPTTKAISAKRDFSLRSSLSARNIRLFYHVRPSLAWPFKVTSVAAGVLL